MSALVVGIDELTHAWSTSLALGEDGTPRRPLIAIDLDSVISVADVLAASAAARRGLALVVGIATKAPDAGLDVLLDALDVTLISAEACCDRRTLVPVDDPYVALTELAAAVTSAPRASVALGQVLRQTEQLDVRAGLAAEAAAYSVLLAGREFRDWLVRRGASRPDVHEAGPVVLVERHGDVLAIALDRTERRNAFNAAVRDALVEALTVAVASPEVRVELSGRGANFSSGGDLDEFGTSTEVDSAYLIRLERHPGWLLHALGDRATVRVHGACIGAGIEMPSLAHRVIATEDACFALPEVGMGVIPGAGGTVGIPRRIGRWRTAWLALTGTRIDAETARAWGLVDDVVGD